MIHRMKTCRRLSILMVLALLFPGCLASADESREVDVHLAKLVARISSTDPGQYEKVNTYCDDLLKYLRSICTEAKVMNSPLSAAQKAGLQVVTSEDRKLRFYSWYTNNGGTMGIFDSLVVYDPGKGKLRCEVLHPSEDSEPGDAGSKYLSIDTIKINDGRPVYLVQDASSYSSAFGARRIESYVITNGKLAKFPLFQTPKKTLDTIEHPWVGYKPGEVIELSPDKQTLRIPLIKTDAGDISKATGKFLDYYFNGSRYVFGKKSIAK